MTSEGLRSRARRRSSLPRCPIQVPHVAEPVAARCGVATKSPTRPRLWSRRADTRRRLGILLEFVFFRGPGPPLHHDHPTRICVPLFLHVRLYLLEPVAAAAYPACAREKLCVRLPFRRSFSLRTRPQIMAQTLTLAKGLIAENLVTQVAALKAYDLSSLDVNG